MMSGMQDDVDSYYWVEKAKVLLYNMGRPERNAPALLGIICDAAPLNMFVGCKC